VVGIVVTFVVVDLTICVVVRKTVGVMNAVVVLVLQAVEGRSVVVFSETPSCWHAVEYAGKLRHAEAYIGTTFAPNVVGRHCALPSLALSVLLDGTVGLGRSGSTLGAASTSVARLCSGGSVEVTMAKDVTTAVENVVVILVTSRTVDVVVVVSLIKAVAFTGSTSVVSCVCCSVHSTGWTTVSCAVLSVVFVTVMFPVLVRVAGFADRVNVKVFVDVLSKSERCIKIGHGRTWDTERRFC